MKPQPGQAFRFRFLDEGIFLFGFPSTTQEGQALCRKFNTHGAFIEKAWFRVPLGPYFLERAQDYDMTEGRAPPEAGPGA